MAAVAAAAGGGEFFTSEQQWANDVTVVHTGSQELLSAPVVTIKGHRSVKEKAEDEVQRRFGKVALITLWRVITAAAAKLLSCF